MKKLIYKQTENIVGGGAMQAFCTGVGIGRLGIAGFNYFVAIGVISGAAVATGGAILAITATCTVYGAGKFFDLW